MEATTAGICRRNRGALTEGTTLKGFGSPRGLRVVKACSSAPPRSLPSKTPDDWRNTNGHAVMQRHSGWQSCQFEFAQQRCRGTQRI